MTILKNYLLLSFIIFSFQISAGTLGDYLDDGKAGEATEWLKNTDEPHFDDSDRVAIEGWLKRQKEKEEGDEELRSLLEALVKVAVMENLQVVVVTSNLKNDKNNSIIININKNRNDASKIDKIIALNIMKFLELEDVFMLKLVSKSFNSAATLNNTYKGVLENLRRKQSDLVHEYNKDFFERKKAFFNDEIPECLRGTFAGIIVSQISAAIGAGLGGLVGAGCGMFVGTAQILPVIFTGMGLALGNVISGDTFLDFVFTAIGALVGLPLLAGTIGGCVGCCIGSIWLPCAGGIGLVFSPAFAENREILLGTFDRIVDIRRRKKKLARIDKLLTLKASF